jgi:hypothetical protein
MQSYKMLKSATWVLDPHPTYSQIVPCAFLATLTCQIFEVHGLLIATKHIGTIIDVVSLVVNPLKY